jgi:hypothetical protein
VILKHISSVIVAFNCSLTTGGELRAGKNNTTTTTTNNNNNNKAK